MAAAAKKDGEETGIKENCKKNVVVMVEAKEGDGVGGNSGGGGSMGEL